MRWSMKTQLEAAREGIITAQISTVARNEGLAPELVKTLVAAGEIVILSHPQRPQQQAVGIGTGLRTKVNAAEQANIIQAKETGEAQQATKERDGKMDALDSAMSEFYALAELAYEDAPDLLEMLDR
jgi:thiamine biosynthesis protein ThiC